MIFGFYDPEYPKLCLEIALSLTACGKSDCFAVSMFDERVFPYSPQGGFRYFKGHFRTRWCLRCVFCSVMHHCVVRRSGSVPTEITEPALEARSSRHVFIETLQSKDFPASLLICDNFQITAFRVHSSQKTKIILKTVPHQKQYGRVIVFGAGGLRKENAPF